MVGALGLGVVVVVILNNLSRSIRSYTPFVAATTANAIMAVIAPITAPPKERPPKASNCPAVDNVSAWNCASSRFELISPLTERHYASVVMLLSDF